MSTNFVIISCLWLNQVLFPGDSIPQDTNLVLVESVRAPHEIMS
jgi:hypothetical protein